MMSGKLYFDLNLKKHPYPEDSGAHLEVWGEITLRLQQQTEQLILTKVEWDIIPLAEWFVQVQDDLCQDTLSIIDPITGSAWQPRSSESLAQALNRFRQRDFSDEEDAAEFQWSTQLYEFYQRHGLQFALPGSKVEDIIIGSNVGIGEISLWVRDNSWTYYFDMPDFCEDLRGKLSVILSKGLTNGNNQFVSHLSDLAFKQSVTA